MAGTPAGTPEPAQVAPLVGGTVTGAEIVGGAIVFVVIVAITFGLLCVLWYWDERHWK